jgi:hypothetical protein
MLPRVSTLATIVALGILGPGVASAESPAAGQMAVSAVPEEVFGLSVDAGVRSTIPVETDRERIGSTTVVTVTPRD